MCRNVLDYEPGTALFVPDCDPLLFYRAVADISWSYLVPGGIGAVEINERYGEATKAVFSERGFSNVTVIQDLSGRDRFVFFNMP